MFKDLGQLWIASDSTLVLRLPNVRLPNVCQAPDIRIFADQLRQLQGTDGMYDESQVAWSVNLVMPDLWMLGLVADPKRYRKYINRISC